MKKGLTLIAVGGFLTATASTVLLTLFYGITSSLVPDPWTDWWVSGILNIVDNLPIWRLVLLAGIAGMMLQLIGMITLVVTMRSDTETRPEGTITDIWNADADYPAGFPAGD